MGALGILGGIGQGIAAGTQDLERMQNQKFLRGQRKRLETQQAAEDAAEGEIKALDTNAPDYNAQVAGIYKSHGRVKDAAAFTDRHEAGVDRTRTRARQDIEDRQRRHQEILNHAGWMADNGQHLGALHMLKGAYTGIPDGHQIVVDDAAGTWGVAGPGGKWVQAPQAASPESVRALVQQGMKYINPQQWAAAEQVRQGDHKLRQGDRTLDINQAEVDMKRPYYVSAAEENRASARLKDRTDPNASASAYRASAFTPLGLSDDGTHMLGRSGPSLVEQPVPKGYSTLFPKVTGAKPPPRKFDSASLGQLGLTQDDAGNLYTVDARGQLQSVPMPGENATIKALREFKGSR